jgi:hypothetical protein
VILSRARAFALRTMSSGNEPSVLAGPRCCCFGSATRPSGSPRASSPPATFAEVAAVGDLLLQIDRTDSVRMAAPTAMKQRREQAVGGLVSSRQPERVGYALGLVAGNGGGERDQPSKAVLVVYGCRGLETTFDRPDIWWEGGAALEDVIEPGGVQYRPALVFADSGDGEIQAEALAACCSIAGRSCRQTRRRHRAQRRGQPLALDDVPDRAERL